jgi:HAD superfamily hydrolase (TIGR01509 family)
MPNATEPQAPEPAGHAIATPIAGIIFDLDGTLVESALDFAAMRLEMGLPPGRPILEALALLPATKATRCRDILHRHEQAGAERATPVAGIPELLARIDARGLRRAVFTRNSRRATERALARGLHFDHIVTRDDGPVKPDPWAVLYLCRLWQAEPERVLVIGDYRFDIEAGRNAGARTLLYTRGHPGAGLPGAELADGWLESFSDPGQILIMPLLGLERPPGMPAPSRAEGLPQPAPPGVETLKIPF